MSSFKVLVITRQLPGHEKVVHSVETVPTDVSEEGYESLCRDNAERAKRRFSSQFAEFDNATFHGTVHDCYSNR